MMLVLRLLLMVLSIICLMDGHAEVTSSTTGIRNVEESPAVMQNEPEVKILDRKKKKPKKPKKGNKKKGKKPKQQKAKTTKSVTTTRATTTSTLKTTTTSTTPTMKTTEKTTVATSPTTTETTIDKTTISTTTTTSAITTSTSTTSETTTSSTSTTTSTTIMTSTATTSSPTTTAATTADSGDAGECKATNGKPCVFPFKDGKTEYNECKNHGGTYFWCATAVSDSGKYTHWSYCPTDRSCPLEGDGECRAENTKPCVFPFKDGKKEYNECADFAGKYFWCATGTNSDGKYTAWSKCPKDGSCPLPEKSTLPLMTSPATTSSTTLQSIGTTAETDKMEEKVIDTLENLVVGESRGDSLQMAHMLNEKLDTIIKDLEGETSKTESGKSNITIRHGQDGNVRDGTQLGEGLMFVLSTVDSMKSVSRLSGDCCTDCIRKHPDTQLSEYWASLHACYCYKKIKNVEPKTRPSSKFTTKSCDLCRKATAKDCPSDSYTFMKGGFSKVPDDKIIKRYHVSTKCDCRKHCDDLKPFCKAFLFSTCTQSTEERCLLLNEDRPYQADRFIEHYAFCKRDVPGKKNLIQMRPSGGGSAISGCTSTMFRRIVADSAMFQTTKHEIKSSYFIRFFHLHNDRVINNFVKNNNPWLYRMPNVLEIAMWNAEKDKNNPELFQNINKLYLKAQVNKLNDIGKQMEDPTDLNIIDPRSELRHYHLFLMEIAASRNPRYIFVAQSACSYLWCVIGVELREEMKKNNEVCNNSNDKWRYINALFDYKENKEACSNDLRNFINKHITEEDVPEVQKIYDQALYYEKIHLTWITKDIAAKLPNFPNLPLISEV